MESVIFNGADARMFSGVDFLVAYATGLAGLLSLGFLVACLSGLLWQSFNELKRSLMRRA
jgi:hypothetical protein